MMNSKQIEKEIGRLNNHEKSTLLLTYGHLLTIRARDAYEFQSPGVINPRLLRDINEILHRVFQALREIEVNDDSCFSLNGIHHWISCEEKQGDIVNASISAFSEALKKC